MQIAAPFLPRDFYARDTSAVARELLGQYLLRRLNGDRLVCRIVETEAYYGSGDPASHAARGRTPRSGIMFGPAGHAYVYFNYGVHYLLNVVTEAEGTAGAVLIRALEPVEGIETMLANRPVVDFRQLANGPGKLTKALSIDLRDNGADLTRGNLGIVRGDSLVGDRIVAGPRIGIREGKEYPYRFYIEDNQFVSRRNGDNNEAKRHL